MINTATRKQIEIVVVEKEFFNDLFNCIKSLKLQVLQADSIIKDMRVSKWKKLN